MKKGISEQGFQKLAEAYGKKEAQYFSFLQELDNAISPIVDQAMGFVGNETVLEIDQAFTEFLLKVKNALESSI